MKDKKEGPESADRPKITVPLSRTRYEVLKIILIYLYSDFVIDEKDWKLLNQDTMAILIETAAQYDLKRYRNTNFDEIGLLLW